MSFFSVVFAAGSYAEEATAYPILITGRVLHGVGNGASIVTSKTMISNAWNSQASIMGWYILWGRAGSAMNYALNGGILTMIGMSNCLWIVVGFTTVGSLAGLILARQDDGESPPENFLIMTKLWKFLKDAKAVFWAFTLVNLLVHSTVSTFTSNGPSLLGVFSFSYFFRWSVPTLIVPILMDINLWHIFRRELPKRTSCFFVRN